MKLDELPALHRISDYLFFHAERDPKHEIAIAGDLRITYGEMAEQVTALSRALVDLGVTPGDRVATLATPRPEFLMAFLAATDIGAVWVGLNPKYKRRELVHVVTNSGPRVVMGITNYRDQDLAGTLHALGEIDSVEHVIAIGGDYDGGVGFEDLIDMGRGLEDAGRLAARDSSGGHQAAVLVYTSGTTGAPKGAMLTHYSLCWSFLRQARRWEVESPRIICNLPINHSGCLGDNVSTCLIAGGTLILMEEFDPDGMLELIESEGVDALMQVPTQYQVIVGSDRFASTNLNSLEFLVWGGAAIARPVLEKILEKDVRVQVMYGMSEAPGSLTYSRPGASLEQLTSTIGKPDPEIEFRIVDSEGSICAVGEAGEIQVRHESVFIGYFGDPDATEAAFSDDGFLRTGDQAAFRDDGYVEMVGRLKEMYKSGGYNVYPREIEMAIERHPAVASAVVVSVPDPLWSEIGCAFAVTENGQEVNPEEIVAWCRKELANYKVPKQVQVLSELPVLPIGKPDKAALRILAQGEVNKQADQNSGPEEGTK